MKEMLPQIRADPDFFAKRNFDLKDRGGSPVDPATVDWSSISARNFPFTLVERSGPNNSLGRVKFMFPNEYAVYLHDTTSKPLFDKAARAFSHGCIRVEDPFGLAGLLLGPDGRTDERIREVLNTGKTTTVFLPRPLPILILYWTAEVDPEGLVNFYPDIYARDQAIADGLDAAFRLELPAR